MTPAEAFIQRVTASVEDLGLFYSAQPDQNVWAALSQTRQNLASELAEVFGAEVAASFADGFVAAVAGRRRELMLN